MTPRHLGSLASMAYVRIARCRVLLMYGVLFGPKYYVHSLDRLQLVIVELMALRH